MHSKPRFAFLENIGHTESSDDFSNEVNTESPTSTARMDATINTLKKLSIVMEYEEADENARRYFISKIYSLQDRLAEQMATPVISTFTRPDTEASIQSSPK